MAQASVKLRVFVLNDLVLLTLSCTLFRMNSPHVRAITIEGPTELLHLLSSLRIDDLQVGLTVPAASPVDMLDAPMSKNKFKATLQILTLLFGTATASVKFANELETFLKDNPEVTITIRNALDGSLIGKFDKTSGRESFEQKLKL